MELPKLTDEQLSLVTEAWFNTYGVIGGMRAAIAKADELRGLVAVEKPNWETIARIIHNSYGVGIPIFSFCANSILELWPTVAVQRTLDATPKPDDTDKVLREIRRHIGGCFVGARAALEKFDKVMAFEPTADWPDPNAPQRPGIAYDNDGNAVEPVEIKITTGVGFGGTPSVDLSWTDPGGKSFQISTSGSWEELECYVAGLTAALETVYRTDITRSMGDLRLMHVQIDKKPRTEADIDAEIDRLISISFPKDELADAFNLLKKLHDERKSLATAKGKA